MQVSQSKSQAIKGAPGSPQPAQFMHLHICAVNTDCPFSAVLHEAVSYWCLYIETLVSSLAIKLTVAIAVQS